MNYLILSIFFLVGCSKKYLSRNYSAKHQLVDISSERSFDKLTPKMRKRAKLLKSEGFKIRKKKDGYFAIKGKKKFLLIDDYQCIPY